MECVKLDADLHNRHREGPRTPKKRNLVCGKNLEILDSIPQGEYFAGCIEPTTKTHQQPILEANSESQCFLSSGKGIKCS